jgi:hypothetical protein
MLKSFLLLLVLGFVALPQVAKADPLCGGYNPEIDIVPMFGNIERDRSLRAVNLNSRDAWGDLMVDHIDARVSLKSHNTFTTKKPKKGSDVCVILSAVKILYKLDVTLKVIEDYPKDSCEYKESIAHQERHIALSKDFLQQTVPMLRDYIAENMKDQAGLTSYVSHTDRYEAQLNRTMNNLLDIYTQHMQHEHRRVQRELIDVPAERAKLMAACPDWKHPHAYR